MTGKHMWGITQRRMTQAQCKRADRIARARDASFVHAVIPGTGWQGWFECPGRGNPFDQAIEADVMSAVRADALLAGVWS